MRHLYFFIFFLSIASVSYSQCKNSISLKKAANETGLKNGGVIEISVVSADQYVCTLNIVKGTGPQKIQTKNGQGNSIIRFEGLDTDLIYQVQVEFLSDNTICRKLQKSQIVLDGE